jgi:hypothetical protein
LDLGEENVLEVLQTAEYLGEGRLSDICQQVTRERMMVMMMLMMVMVTISDKK